ncbi:MAG: bifunctional phosphopantothenoylcysteine decarboxylase/phosphopantothenate--cysteine ligase CoaBC [Deltaproteobacteria bacterium]|nr:bifunctional phosphopantothenoylcysteine decarboxylase/phosphopantothenate--cysteine ligase CoaBC [Deltaproteobacteria bacterium]
MTANLRPALEGKKILLGITGSIAAFKACEIVRTLRECGAHVRVVLTENAEQFVTRLTLETLSGEPVYTSLWGVSTQGNQGTHHIDAARWADLVLVAPATANTLAKLAHGLADDLLSTELLAFQGPVLIAPAMNPAMFAHPAVTHNVARLVARGVRMLGPVPGLTACGEEGLGRMLEPDDIVELVAQAFYAKLNGKKAVITLGPTRSPIDPVRFISNRSSGLMGAALAWACVRAGYQVTAICGPTEARLPQGITVTPVKTAAEMATSALAAWPHSDFFIAAAAVLDWDVANPKAGKIKKESGELPRLEFARNPDILAEAARQRRNGQFVLGFAAETDSALRNGMTKLLAKNCDAIFINDISKPNQGFETNSNAGWWVSRNPRRVFELSTAPKSQLAITLLALAEGRAPQAGQAVELVLENLEYLEHGAARNALPRELDAKTH